MLGRPEGDPPHLARVLRPRGKRQTCRRAAHKRDEFTPLHCYCCSRCSNQSVSNLRRKSKRPDVRSRSISTELGCPGHVRFTFGSDRITDIPDRQPRAKGGSHALAPNDVSQRGRIIAMRGLLTRHRKFFCPAALALSA